MKRCLLLSALLCVFSITHMYAETTTPSITLTTTKTDVIEMKFGCRTAHTIHIDWGDGKLVETVEIADSATVYPTASSAAIQARHKREGIYHDSRNTKRTPRRT